MRGAHCRGWGSRSPPRCWKGTGARSLLFLGLETRPGALGPAGTKDGDGASAEGVARAMPPEPLGVVLRKTICLGPGSVTMSEIRPVSCAPGHLCYAAAQGPP